MEAFDDTFFDSIKKAVESRGASPTISEWLDAVKKQKSNSDSRESVQEG